MPDPTLRPLDPANDAEVAHVAARMQATLVEVLGAERARAVHTLDECLERLRWHLECAPGRRAAVLVADLAGVGLVGHALVRVESDEAGEFGLFATLWVEPGQRRGGLAARLIAWGEAWMRAQGQARARTWTERDNAPLIRLFEAHGYAASRELEGWTILTRAL